MFKLDLEKAEGPDSVNQYFLHKITFVQKFTSPVGHQAPDFFSGKLLHLMQPHTFSRSELWHREKPRTQFQGDTVQSQSRGLLSAVLPGCHISRSLPTNPPFKTVIEFLVVVV